MQKFTRELHATPHYLLKIKETSSHWTTAARRKIQILVNEVSFRRPAGASCPKDSSIKKNSKHTNISLKRIQNLRQKFRPKAASTAENSQKNRFFGKSDHKTPVKTHVQEIEEVSPF